MKLIEEQIAEILADAQHTLIHSMESMARKHALDVIPLALEVQQARKRLDTIRDIVNWALVGPSPAHQRQIQALLKALVEGEK